MLSLVSIMIPHLRQQNPLLGDAIDETMLLVNAPRPITGERMAEWFGFADAGVRIAFDLLEQLMNPADDLFVRPCQYW